MAERVSAPKRVGQRSRVNEKGTPTAREGGREGIGPSQSARMKHVIVVILDGHGSAVFRSMLEALVEEVVVVRFIVTDVLARILWGLHLV